MSPKIIEIITAMSSLENTLQLLSTNVPYNEVLFIDFQRKFEADCIGVPQKIIQIIKAMSRMENALQLLNAHVP